MKILSPMTEAQDAVSKEYVDGLLGSGGGGEQPEGGYATKEELDNLANEMVANEEVHAAAYNDLNTRLNELSKNVQGETVTKEALQNLQNEVIANEEVTAAALNELNERIENAASVAYPEINHGTSDTTFTLTPNTFHVWDEVSALTLTLGSKTSGIVNEFLFQFTSGATATNLTLPTGLAYLNGDAPTIEANSTYQVSIVNGLCVIAKFA